MKFEKTQVYNFEGAIRGMRNPYDSWDAIDSFICDDKVTTFDDCQNCRFYDAEKDIIKCMSLHDEPLFVIGERDMALMQQLIRAGAEHRKFMRQIFVSVDVTAPLYWWKEADQTKVGTVTNSTSTMHTLTQKPITEECFERGDLLFTGTIKKLEYFRKGILEAEDKEKKKALWKGLIVNLPESWLQTRTLTLNYENILTMYRQRKSHKLTEWSVDFVDWVKTLPYAEQLLMI